MDGVAAPGSELWPLFVINYGKNINNKAEMAQNGRGLLFGMPRENKEGKKCGGELHWAISEAGIRVKYKRI